MVCTTISLSLLLLQAFFVLAHSNERSPGAVEVKTQAGTVRGYIASEGSNQAAVFKGIPYAKPPVGDLRWRPPQTPDPWSSVLETTQFQHNCLQDTSPKMMGWTQPLDQLSEDCLYLNVYAPHTNPPMKGDDANNDKEGLPVLLWIYGGGFQGGGGNETRLNGTWVTLQNQNMVIVTFNYRLNVFGFLAAEELRSRDTVANSTGNYGIQDQRMAMQWVQDNIAAFGGDPDRVLLVGQSAGAASVSEHLVRPKSWGLFARAGLESGAYYLQNSQPSVEQMKDSYRKLIKQANCASSTDAVQCLVDLDAHELLKIDVADQWTTWVPTVDGVELVEPAVDLAEAGKMAPGVPLLVGSVSEDIAIFGTNGCDPQRCNADDFLEFAKKNVRLNDTAAAELQQLYSDEVALPGGNYTAWFWAQKHAGADAWATCPARRLARWSTDSPGRRSNPENAYLYYWSYVPMGPNGEYPKLAHHACEQPFVFHVLNETLAEIAEDGGNYRIAKEEIPFSDTIVNLWTSFAASGRRVKMLYCNSNPDAARPTSEGVDWPAFKGANESLHFAQHSIAPEANIRSAKCDFFDRLYQENVGVPLDGWITASLKALTLA